ncbi:diacylglycerol kinase family lipid kinase [Arthrobacter sp. I2-34]|uniref:Diacylglycerol kinase family lipid kinase n=1 Tax=Arthrobacter hankyongi TaxID=2904801 RepID=A0ABS9LCL9_9MICC|nr:diacylglycerol kinase family protein [Arthrobacter hankyongi]MCG2624224.1 diacylglycerol kinase family lipid kinase [Arthrobacter hankyongi]
MDTQWVVGLAVAIVAAAVLLSWLSVRRIPRPRPEQTGTLPPPRSAGIQRVALVLNPIKNDAETARRKIAAACAEAGWDDLLVLETTLEDPGHSQTRRALAAGADVVLAGGGDGTLRVVASELAGGEVPVGLVPLGTGNLLARNLGMDPNDLDTSIHTALHGEARRIDTATITLENRHTGTVTHDTFLVMAGIGLDAEVLAATRDELKKRIGWMAYSEAGVRHLPGKRQRVVISLDDGPAEHRRIRSVLFANCGRMPAGIHFVPDALVDDGELDIVVLSPRSVFGWLWIGAKTVLKHRAPIPVIDYIRARKIRITAPEPMNTQLDGDLSGLVTALTVQVQPASLSVRVDPLALRDNPGANSFSD